MHNVSKPRLYQIQTSIKDFKKCTIWPKNQIMVQEKNLCVCGMCVCIHISYSMILPKKKKIRKEEWIKN